MKLSLSAKSWKGRVIAKTKCQTDHAEVNTKAGIFAASDVSAVHFELTHTSLIQLQVTDLGLVSPF